MLREMSEGVSIIVGNVGFVLLHTDAGLGPLEVVWVPNFLLALPRHLLLSVLCPRRFLLLDVLRRLLERLVVPLLRWVVRLERSKEGRLLVGSFGAVVAALRGGVTSARVGEQAKAGGVHGEGLRRTPDSRLVLHVLHLPHLLLPVVRVGDVLGLAVEERRVALRGHLFLYNFASLITKTSLNFLGAGLTLIVVTDLPHSIVVSIPRGPESPWSTLSVLPHHVLQGRSVLSRGVELRLLEQVVLVSSL